METCTRVRQKILREGSIRHNLGKVSSTKGSRPWVMVHFEKFETRAEAVAREKYLKSGVGREYLRSIGL